MMKRRSRLLGLITAAALLVTTLAGCGSAPATAEEEPDATDEVQETETTHGNYTDEMKMEEELDLDPEAGADAYERQADHVDSPYYSQLDFYNMESTDSLTILTNFQTYQQTNEYSCGLVSALMVLNWFGLKGDYTEESLCELRGGTIDGTGTNLSQLIGVFEKIGGFELHSTYDIPEDARANGDYYSYFNEQTVQDYLKAGIPVMICWNDWGGHWQVIVGYDTMGTEDTADDVLIVADPYDTTDHNQDGYGVYPAQRFFANFSTYTFFQNGELNDYLFLAVEPAA